MKKTEVYKLEKAPTELLNGNRGNARGSYPLTEMGVGQMFKASAKQRCSIYNAIKHRRNYTKEIVGRKFTIKTLPNNVIAVIRLK